jgi:small subunit ribosomal protein S14e
MAEVKTAVPKAAPVKEQKKKGGKGE